MTVYAKDFILAEIRKELAEKHFTETPLKFESVKIHKDSIRSFFSFSKRCIKKILRILHLTWR